MGVDSEVKVVDILETLACTRDKYVFFRYRREYFTFFLSFIVVRFYTCIKLKLFGLSSYHILMFILNGFVLHSVYVPAVVNGHHVDGRDVNAQKGETKCVFKNPSLLTFPLLCTRR